MKRILLICFVLMSALISEAFAQRTVTGEVTGPTGEGLPGVSVRVKGTSTGVITDFDGQYRVEVPAGAETLVFSFVGFATQEVPVGNRSVVDVVLAEDVKQLEEVVVTAYGIEKSKNELSYAAQSVEGEALNQQRDANFINSLSGRVAGLNIRRSGTMGGSTNVVIRGSTSLSGNNQALFVVDGVPIDNSINNTDNQRTGRGGFDYGNAASDINPDNIESVTVLKGAAATVLYGSRAANGVILITTKKGSKGLGVTVNSGVTTGTIDRSTFPTYQNRYGAGYYPWNEEGYWLSRDLDGDGEAERLVPFLDDASYGAEFNPNLLVYHWDALDPDDPDFMQPRPWVAAENTPADFYERAWIYNNSIFINGGNEDGTFKLGYTRYNEEGVLPNSQIDKNLVNFGGAYNITDGLRAEASLSYTHVEGLGRFGTGYDSRNPNQAFRQWWQTNVDIEEQRVAYFRDRRNITWNWEDPEDLNPIYMDNPYWTRFENFQNDERSRYFGIASLNYEVTDWFSVLGRAGLDYYSELQEERIAVGSVDVSEYRRFNRTFSETNYDFIGNFNRDFNETISLTGLIGTNIRTTRVQSIDAETNAGLAIPGYYALENSVNLIEFPDERDERQRVVGVFANATLGYRDLVFLEAALRRDQASTLAPGNNVYYYPSISTSFVFSELFEVNEYFTYGKLRANYAEVGNAPEPYRLRDPYTISIPFGGVALASVPNSKFNPNLRPERTNSWEVGLESSFMDARVGFDVTYYNMNSVDQIFALPVSTATGYNYRWINAGSVVNKGWEVQFFAVPVRNDDFTWTTTFNWSRNRNRVVEIYTDEEGNEIQNLLLASPQGGISINAALGEPYGTIRGRDFVYDEETGQRVIGSNGYYLRTPTSNNIIGDVNPDWIGGITNNLKYKNVALDFLVDFQKGGDVFTLDLYYGMGTGLYPETAGLNDLGNPVRDPVTDDETSGGVILEGVTEEGEVNTQRVDAGSVYGPFGWVRSPAAAFVYDASFVKLRQLSLTYSLPASLLENVGAIKAIDLSLIGNNLWIIHKNLPYADPEAGLSAGNIQGYQSGVYPTVRNYGFNLRVRF